MCLEKLLTRFKFSLFNTSSALEIQMMQKKLSVKNQD